MKEHITQKQLNEFIELKFDEKGLAIIGINNRKFDKLHELLGLRIDSTIQKEHINVIKMIDILERNECQYINPMKYPKNFNGWIIDVVLKDGTRYQENHAELCDGLWEVIKIEINKMISC